MFKKLTLVMLSLTSIFTWQFVEPKSTSQTQKQPIQLPPQYGNNSSMVRCSLTRLEQQFAQSFPGVIETYRHDHGIVIFREVYGATRKLHDSSTCLKASGLKLAAPSLEVDKENTHWKTYAARNSKNSVKIRSTIIERGSGKSWASVEEWFWHAFFSNSSRRYLAITEINDAREEGDFY